MADSLWSYGTRLYSHPLNGAAAYMSVGTALANAPVGGLNDGVLGVYAGANETTAAFAIDMGQDRIPDFAAIFNHNITAGTVRLQASLTSDFAALVANVAMTFAQPHFWVDLRGLAEIARTARYWRALVTANANAVKIGELAIGRIDATRCYQWGYQDSRTYLERVKGTTPWEVLHRTKLGITRRDRTDVRFVGPDRTVEAVLRRVIYSAGTTVIPAIFVPLDTAADVWLLESPATFTSKRVLENRLEVVLALPEQSPGLLSALLGTRAVSPIGATVHYVKLYLSTNVTILNGVATLVAFNSETEDASGLHDNVSNPSRIVIPSGGDGLWAVVGQASWAPSAGTWAAVMACLNGAVKRRGETTLHSTYGLTHQVATVVRVTAGQYLEIAVQQNSGGSLSLLGSSDDLTGVEVYGPLP